MIDSPYQTPTHLRPVTPAQVAAWSHDLREFGYNATDWLHELQKIRHRPELVRSFAMAPRRLSGLFPEGDVCDATLAAQVEWLCQLAGARVPDWVSATPAAAKPWFAEPENRFSRAEALFAAPSPFRNRNIFYVPWVRLTFAKGRPRVSEEIKRAKSAERQRRYRQNLLKAAGRK